MWQRLADSTVTKNNARFAWNKVHSFIKDLSSGAIPPDQAEQKLSEAGKSLPFALQSSSMPGRNKELAHLFLDQFQRDGDEEAEAPLPIEAVRRRLSNEGFTSTESREGYINKRHVFEMSYGSDGGFRGSRSYEEPGETFAYSIGVDRQSGGVSTDPAALHINYDNAIAVGPGRWLENTPFEGRSSSSSLYIVDNPAFQSNVATVMPDKKVIASPKAVADSLKPLLNSLEQHSSIQFHNYTEGYGRVGTEHLWGVDLPGLNLHLSGHSYDLSPDRLNQVAVLGQYALHFLPGMGGTIQPGQAGSPAQANPLTPPSPLAEGIRGAARGTWKGISSFLASGGFVAILPLAVASIASPALGLLAASSLLGGCGIAGAVTGWKTNYHYAKAQQATAQTGTIQIPSPGATTTTTTPVALQA